MKLIAKAALGALALASPRAGTAVAIRPCHKAAPTARTSSPHQHHPRLGAALAAVSGLVAATFV